jgi:hypothetical protein
MKKLLLGTVLLFSVESASALAADAVVVRGQPGRAVARLATQGIGYSVLHLGPGVAAQSYRVHVTCTISDTFSQTSCPTAAYEAYCPSAEIVCR